MEKITILGAYGTKGPHQETSSFLINKAHVIDAGNLLRSLDEEAAEINTIWITHSHLDHIIDIAYILDSYYTLRTKSLKLMGLPATLEAICKDIVSFMFRSKRLSSSQKKHILQILNGAGEGIRTLDSLLGRQEL